MGGRGKQVGEADRRFQPERALPILWTGPSVLAAVGESEEESSDLFVRKLRMWLGEPIATPAFRRQVARIGGVLSGDDENPALHVQ